MAEPWDPDWYIDNVLADSEPGSFRPVRVRPAADWQAWWDRRAGADDVVGAAARHGFVLSTAEVAELGCSRSALRTALRRGRWWSPVRGFVAPLCLGDDANPHVVARRRHAVAVSAAVRARSGHVAASRSAATLHGLPTFRLPQLPELNAPTDAGLGPQSPVHAFSAGLPPAAVTAWHGIAVTTAARTVVDLARRDRRDGLMAADAALGERLASVADLDRELLGAAGWPGVRQARAVLALADPRAESPLESLTRLALHDSEFPAPELQWYVNGYWADLCWPASRLVVEVDGLDKYEGDAFRAEKRREQHLRRAGYRVERVIWNDVVVHWPATAARLRAALAGH